MNNPFLFGTTVTGKFFTDRKEELQSLVRDLSSGQNVLMFSPRRFGKTSLVKRALEALSARGLVTAYVDVFQANSVEEFGELYARAITRATATTLDDIVAFVRRHLPVRIPTISMKGPADTEFQLDFESPRRNVKDWVESIIELPQRLAVKAKKRWVVVFDEFQEVATLSPSGSLEKSLRSIIQHQHKVAYVFMGSKRQMLDELFMDKNKPRYNIARPVLLGRIPQEEFASFIHSRFREGKITLSNDMVQEILTLTNAIPISRNIYARRCLTWPTKGKGKSPRRSFKKRWKGASPPSPMPMVPFGMN
jgi:AAA+ ATPase superfamily predicted ATPase